MAASSAAIERTWASAAASTATALSPVPNPPRMMLASDRFIASAISLVRMLPDAPTSAPATISAQFPMTNPAIATAVPVNAFTGTAVAMAGFVIGNWALIEPGHRHRGAGERVQQRDDHRHVRAADRQHHHHPERQRGQHHDEQRGQAGGGEQERGRADGDD